LTVIEGKRIIPKPAKLAGDLLKIRIDCSGAKDMPPQPKRKISKGRRDRRRAHDALTERNLVQCSNCGEMRLPHTVCPSCGHYKGREIIATEEKK
jgi:large subunit ribosomal protein L32